MKLHMIVVCLLLFAGVTRAQRQASVYDTPGTVLANPWAGGMNACQFGAVDIDLDGNDDLVVFDRNGDRIMTFLWEQGEDYLFAPQYADHFPRLYDWAVFVDYDGDGRKDIFTYSPGYASMMVYRNISAASLEFERIVYPYLTSFQGGGYVNILVTYADYPGIYDVDGDGDLDILTFWGLGSFIELHLNLSMEKYGHADSLDYEQVDFCWGRFAESEESNEITLDTCIGGGRSEQRTGLLPHTGSTFLIGDMNGDGVPDLVLGDVDYPNLILLVNGGTGTDAVMISQDRAFPSGDVPVRLYSMPLPVLIDINHDGLDDLLVSPFDPTPQVVENKSSIWYYRNEGFDTPDYRLVKRDFLQEGMIDVGSGAYPVLEDYDGDGLLDLFIGNYGYYDSSQLDQNLILKSYYTSRLALFRNTGTAQQPAFLKVTDDFAGLSSLGLTGIHPAFVDTDSDGDLDMLAGNSEGTVLFFENIAETGQAMEMVLADDEFMGIDVGRFSAPSVADLDQDGYPDLVIGEQGGNLNFYRNTAAPADFVVEYVTDSLGGVNVTDYNVSLDGFSRPSFFIDNSGAIGLLVGSHHGKVFQFKDIEGNINGDFKETDSLFQSYGTPPPDADRGLRTAAFAARLRDNAELDVIVGNFSGGLEYFSNHSLPGVDLRVPGNELCDLVKIYPNPAVERIMVEVRDAGSGVMISMAMIVDAEGRHLVSVKSPGKKMAMDVSGLDRGVYLCRIILEGPVGEFPVVKKIILLD